MRFTIIHNAQNLVIFYPILVFYCFNTILEKHVPEKPDRKACPKILIVKCARSIFDDGYTLLALFELQKYAR